MDDRRWIEVDGKRYAVPPGASALDALREQGADVAFSCRSGICRTCMLQLISGYPGSSSVDRLPEDYRELGFFLPCRATDVHAVEACAPDLARLTRDATLAEKELIGYDLVILRLEPLLDVHWQPGQTVELLDPRGTGRVYSIVSRKEDYFLELHLRIHPRGAVGTWARDGLRIGDGVQFRGPAGHFVYHDRLRDHPLIMIGTGTGGGALLGLAREALARGHAGPIHLYHGARTHAALYLSSEMQALAERDHKVEVTCRASREAGVRSPAGRIGDLALREHPNLGDAAIYVSGNPDMVRATVDAARLRGADPARVFCELFERHGDVIEKPLSQG